MLKMMIKTHFKIMKKKNLLVSTSGGRTSALMAYLLWTRYQEQYNMLFVFANTSREMEETLEFIKVFQEYFKIPITWVEAVVFPQARVGTSYTEVDFYSANRDGKVFEAVIAKYGIPNISSPHCTRELKSRPINKFAIDYFGGRDYITAIGYRKDEPKRVNLLNAEKNKHWYPLWEWGITKNDVLEFWKKQPFDLELQEHQGNCQLCFKKSKRKIILQLTEDIMRSAWIRLMEQKYGNKVPAAFKGKLPVRFYRDYESIDEIIAQIPEASTQIEFDFELDEQEDCAESCEPF